MKFITRAGSLLKTVAKPFSHPQKFVKEDVVLHPSELPEQSAAAASGLMQTVGRNTFNIKENPESLLGFDLSLTGKAKAAATIGIVGSMFWDIGTRQTRMTGPTENGIKTATPTLDEYLDPAYSQQQPSYANNTNADGDLVLALNKNRNG